MKHSDNSEELSIRILDYTFLERTRRNKQTVLVLTGDPGEAKSSMALALTEKLLAFRGVEFLPHVNDVVVYTPLEFPEKEQALLYDKKLKDIDIMIIDEARLVVKAKNWHEFLNQAIADVFALQRRVKRIFLIIVTQDLDDIDKDVRRLVTFWGECYRPLHGAAEMHISRFYKDTRKPAKIELKKRALRGIIQFPNGRIKLDFPEVFVFKMPSKEVWQTYDDQNYKSKGVIIKKRLAELIAKMAKDSGLDKIDRVDLLLNHFFKTPEKVQELLFHFHTTKKGNYKLREGADAVFGLKKEEAEELGLKFKKRILKMQQGGVKENVVSAEELRGEN